jgi:hypothetical protein
MAFGGRPFSVLRVAGFVLAAILLVAAGSVYWFFVSQQRQYIVGRDFRLLANLANQMDNSLEAEVRVLRNLPHGYDLQQLKSRWLPLRGRPYQADDIRFESPSDYAWSATDYTLTPGPPLTLEVPLWSDSTGTKTIVATLKLQPAFDAIFNARVGQGAFDTILLGSQSGQVLLSAGANANSIRSSGLGIFSSTTPDDKPVTFAQLAKSTTMTGVSLAGIDHTLFVFPCCISHSRDSTALVLAGLVPSDSLRSASWAIPTTLVKLAILALLLTLVVWPFLKLMLLGERQHLSVSDLFLLGAASVAGLALGTIVLLDAIAYSRLNTDIDAQLRHLAFDLDENATHR